MKKKKTMERTKGDLEPSPTSLAAVSLPGECRSGEGQVRSRGGLRLGDTGWSCIDPYVKWVIAWVIRKLDRIIYRACSKWCDEFIDEFIVGIYIIFFIYNFFYLQKPTNRFVAPFSRSGSDATEGSGRNGRM